MGEIDTYKLYALIKEMRKKTGVSISTAQSYLKENEYSISRAIFQYQKNRYKFHIKKIKNNHSPELWKSYYSDDINKRDKDLYGREKEPIGVYMNRINGTKRSKKAKI